ncbi:MAG: ribonuclease R [Bacteroidota bacterium]|nr:ribonuclease R [Bacteroidota bacterium]|tara:strand:+ start:812 stop:2914 length:2103 start_codon:yes stop_codon:yes gene_type:complete
MKDRALSKSIIQVLTHDAENAYNYKQIAAVLGVKDPYIRKRIVTLLDQLKKDGQLDEIYRGKYQIKDGSQELTGYIQFISKGGAFFIHPNIQKDIYIHPSNLNKALNGDKVLIKIVSFKGKSEGKVLKVLERTKKEFTGIVDGNKNVFFLIPDDKSVKTHFFIDKKHLNGAKKGQKVKTKFLSWPKHVKSPQVAVTEIIGNPGELNVEMNSILAEFGFPSRFPKRVLNEVELIKEPNYAIESKKRKDFRTKTTFTIDPNDAKDFDDAISIAFLESGNLEIGVHIADVGHYVKPESFLDKEALLRGNSVYLVDRVIPMLPERLSNELCSLRPHEDKLTFSAVFELDPNCNVLSSWFGKTIIHSDHRFTYEDAQEIIEGRDGPFKKEITQINKLAQQCRKQRLSNGALNVKSNEVRFRLDEEGEPIETVLKVSKEAHQLIEEFMLLANREVAKKLAKPEKNIKKGINVFRIHDNPSEEKLNDLKLFLTSMGYEIIRKKNKPITYSLNNIMKDAEKRGELDLISPMIIRAMSKAVYSTDNVGHYGLAFDYYTHFTSPIRRYADLVVHRSLIDFLNEQKIGTDSKHLNYICNHISKMEKQAVDAERASIKYMQVKFLSKFIGDTFEGTISGLTEWGMYVELLENKCEGMISLKSMSDDQYFFDPGTMTVTGYHSQNSFKMGQEVKVRVKKTNLFKRQIDFILED